MQNATPLKHDRRKAVYIPLHNAGGIGKTTTLIAAIEACYHHGEEPAVFTGDVNHNELIRLFGATGFDVVTDGPAFINAIQAPKKYIFIDTPAAFVNIFTDVFGDVNTNNMACEMEDAMPFYIVPIATNDKCIKTLDRIASLWHDVETDYRFIFCLNEGLMTNKATLLEEFYAHPFVQKQLEAGKATTVRITTKFTPSFSNVVKTRRLREFLKEQGSLHDRVLGHDFIRKTDDQFANILGLPAMDNTTEVEKAFGVNANELSGLIPTKSKK